MKNAYFCTAAFIACVTLTAAGCSSGGLSKYDEAWVTYGRDYSNQRFSPLDQINANNVKHLQVAYVVQTGVADAFEATPLESGGVLYVSSAQDHVIAVNAETGELLWQWQPNLKPSKLCCGPVNRGVALTDGLVLIGTLDGRLCALDKGTGRELWSVRVANPALGYSITAAPLVYRDLVITGAAGSEFGVRGFLSAYDAHSGALRWRWYSADSVLWDHPLPNEGSKRLRSDEAVRAETGSTRSVAAESHRGAAVWMTPTVDAANNTVYATTGNPWPDFSGKGRPGQNLYANSIVALDAATGRLKWYYQEVPHDLWDWDVSSPVVLFDTVDAAGHVIKALGEAGKTGWFYVLNRDTGKLIRRSEPFVPQQNMFHSAAGHGVVVRPGPGGGSNWSPVSVNPTQRLAIVTAIDSPTIFSGNMGKVGQDELGVGVAASGRRQGLVSAVQLDSGRVQWQDVADQPLIGGSLSTASGLTFFGESNGFFDAVETATGKLLWQFQTGAGVNAPPIAFSLHGREYVAVASGGNRRVRSRLGDALFVFALPR